MTHDQPGSGMRTQGSSALRCPSNEELVRYQAGELVLNRHHELDAHFGQCPRCDAQRRRLALTVERLATQPGELDDPQLVAEIMARVQGTAQRAPRPATQGDITHVRWTTARPIKPGEAGYVSLRAKVK